MKSRFISMMNLKNKNGQSAITLALLTITFLLLAGFSIDVANLLLQKSHLQRALDAGAIAGITRYSSGDNSTTVETTAVEMALYNLREMGINDPNPDVTATFNVDQDGIAKLSINGSINTKTLFMRLIPGAGLATVVTSGSSTAQRNSAIISLVLDISGSMSASMPKLVEAANTFVNSFEEGVDQMAIITFSDKATVVVLMQAVDKTLLHKQINALLNPLNQAGGYTGFAEGVTLGRLELEKVTNPAAVKAMLAFTDGAPNVIRPVFTNGKTPPLLKNYPAILPQFYDYVARLNTNTPELLNPTAMNATCMHDVNCPVLCPNIANCLNSFAYNDSRGNPGHFAHIPSLNAPYTEMRKESYDLSIIESDYAKTDGATIYTVGLGVNAANAGDPYQDVTVTDKLKAILLRRVANDPASAADPQFPGLAPNGGHPKGVYLQTQTASDLTNLFKSIAQRIKLRLI